MVALTGLRLSSTPLHEICGRHRIRRAASENKRDRVLSGARKVADDPIEKTPHRVCRESVPGNLGRPRVG